MTEQLVLPVMPPANETFDNFFVGHNDPLIASLKNLSKQRAIVYLWGKPDSGCSHLLNASCHDFFKRQRPSIYLSMQQLILTDNFSVLDGLEHLSLICIDDLQEVVSSLEWQKALFDLFNRVQEQDDGSLIFSATQAPKYMGLKLPDLETRLSLSIVYQVKSLDSDVDKIKAIQMQAFSRGFLISDEVGHFLLTRVSRKMSDLVSLLQRVDQQSLLQQRKITIPFIKSLI